MHAPLKLFATGAFALIFSAASAQSDDPAEAKATDIAGLLGRTYLSLDVGALQLRNQVANPTGFASGFDANLPIADGWDYRLSGSYEHAAKTGFKLGDEFVDNGVTYFYRTAVCAPYLSAGFGYEWNHATVNSVRDHHDDFLFDAGTGIEVPVTKAGAVRVGLDYDQAIRKPRARVLGYEVGTNYWFTDAVGASVGAQIRTGRNGAYDSILYTAGVHFSFD